MSQEAPDLFTRLAPVLNVRDLAAERVFCERLGLPVFYEGRSICRTRGRHAAAFQIVLSGIRTPPEWPPGSAFAASFSGVALARRRRRRRGRRR